MLDMGFIRDIRRVIDLLPAQRQNLLFSATFSDEIRRLAATLLHDPAYVQIARRNAPVELVRQVVYPVDRERKRELLSHLVRSGRIDRALVFTRTKHGANRLATQLEHDGIAAGAIHGNKSQGQRVRALDDFKSGRIAILVATEIAARGLDIDALPHVVNFELPMVPADYVHRIGRTGRAGMEGDAISLVCVDEQGLLRDIERVLGQPIAREVVPGFEVDRSIRPEPIRQRSGGDGRLVSRPQGAASRPQSRGSGGRGPRANRPAAMPAGTGRPGQRTPVGIGNRAAGPQRASGRHQLPAPSRVHTTMPGERLARSSEYPRPAAATGAARWPSSGPAAGPQPARRRR
jgi:ATP-dependent RNA helicase RhlE